jgi:hypothetical protein
MPSGWFPDGRRHRDHDPAADEHVDTVLPAAPPRREPREHGPEVLQVDCFGVYVRHVSLWERLECHLLADRLDRTLAAGVQPETDVLLAMRAERIACLTMRRQLARSVRRLIDASADTRTSVYAPRSMAVLPRVAACRADFEELESHLLAPAPLSARGVARVRMLLRDGSGPLYRYESRQDLRRLVRDVIEALEPTADWPA